MYKVCSNVWTCTKMLKLCYFKHNYTLELFMAYKLAYSSCFGLRGNLSTFSTFPPKKVLQHQHKLLLILSKFFPKEFDRKSIKTITGKRWQKKKKREAIKVAKLEFIQFLAPKKTAINKRCRLCCLNKIAASFTGKSKSQAFVSRLRHTLVICLL